MTINIKSAQGGVLVELVSTDGGATVTASEFVPLDQVDALKQAITDAFWAVGPVCDHCGQPVHAYHSDDEGQAVLNGQWKHDSGYWHCFDPDYKAYTAKVNGSTFAPTELVTS